MAKSKRNRGGRPKLTRTAETPLSPSEHRFVTEYLIHFCAGRAYRAAHPDCSRATSFREGHRVLYYPNVRAEIFAELRELRRQARLSPKTVIEQAARVLFADLAECYDQDDNPLPVRKIPLNTRRALQTARFHECSVVTTRGKSRRRLIQRTHMYRLQNKADVLQVLFKHLGLAHDANPLEALLAALPPPLAEQLRVAIAGPNTPVPSPNGQATH